MNYRSLILNLFAIMLLFCSLTNALTGLFVFNVNWPIYVTVISFLVIILISVFLIAFSYIIFKNKYKYSLACVLLITCYFLTYIYFSNNRRNENVLFLNLNLKSDTYVTVIYHPAIIIEELFFSNKIYIQSDCTCMNPEGDSWRMGL